MAFCFVLFLPLKYAVSFNLSSVGTKDTVYIDKVFRKILDSCHETLLSLVVIMLLPVSSFLLLFPLFPCLRVMGHH